MTLFPVDNLGSIGMMERNQPSGGVKNELPGVPRRLSLPSGQQLVVRVVDASDAGRLRSFYEQLDEEATYRRFFTSVLPPASFFERLTSIVDRDGVSLVVVDAATDAIVAEADYELLPNGNGEMAMTVSHPWRGWMGPFLLAMLCQVAEARHVPNFEAEILSTNRPMRAVTRARGEALLPSSDWQSVRVAFSTSDVAPRFAPSTTPKVVVESRSSAFRAITELAAGGYDVMACHGRDSSVPCPLECGAECPLVSSADLVIVAGPDGEERDLLVERHRRLHPSTPVATPRRTPGTPVDAQSLLDVADRYLGSTDSTRSTR